jgi:O-antigen/teichoic acid export membrane protein
MRKLIRNISSLFRSRSFIDLLFLLSTQYAGQVLNVIRGIIVARLLGPYYMGVVNSLSLIQQYGSNSNLGLQQGMAKLVPLSRGKGNFDLSNEYKTQSYSLTIIFTSFITLIGILTIWLYFKEVDLIFKVGASVFFIELYFFQKYIYYNALAKIKQKYRIASISDITLQGSFVFFSIILIYFFSIWGVFASILLKYTFVYLIFKRLDESFEIRFSFNKNILTQLFQTGFTLTVVGLLFTFIFSFDRLFIIRYLPLDELGYYGIAITFSTVISKFTQSISTFIYPKVLIKSGKPDSTRDIQIMLFGLVSIITIVLPLFIAYTSIVVNVIIEYMLPKYIMSILPSKILIYSGFFFVFNDVILSYFISKNNERYIILSLVINGALFVGILAITKFDSIVNIAIISFMIKFVYSLFILIKFLTEINRKKGIKLILIVSQLYMPFAYVCAVQIIFELLFINFDFVYLVILNITFVSLLYIPVFFLKRRLLIGYFAKNFR